MKRTLLIAGTVVLIILIIIGLVYVFAPHAKQTQVQSGGSGFPIEGTSTTTQGLGLKRGAAATMSVPARADGTTPITVNDFIHNGTTIEDPQNPGMYYLAGSVGFCENGTCPHGFENKDFIITYDSSTEFFTIDLRDEPLGRVRQEAEQFLMKTLGIQGNTFCAINYYLGTDVDVNEQYAGTNLGFSFCPHATALP